MISPGSVQEVCEAADSEFRSRRFPLPSIGGKGRNAAVGESAPTKAQRTIFKAFGIVV
jgi:hypothetical protein